MGKSIVLPKKKKKKKHKKTKRKKDEKIRQGFALFKSISRESDLWVTLGDFIVKTRKIGEGNQYSTENQ